MFFFSAVNAPWELGTNTFGIARGLHQTCTQHLHSLKHIIFTGWFVELFVLKWWVRPGVGAF